MSHHFTHAEYEGRVRRLQANLQAHTIDAALIIDDVNQYYFAGSSQNGVLVIPADGTPHFFVRRSHPRAMMESWLAAAGTIHPMKSYRDMLPVLSGLNIPTGRLGIVKAGLSIAQWELLQKAGLHESAWFDIGTDIKRIRAVKSPAEIALHAEAGRRQSKIFEAIPNLLAVGMTEWELGMAIRQLMLSYDDPGFSRFSMGNRIPSAGYFCFGDSAVYPTSFDGPGGIRGLNTAIPVSGSPDKKLKPGEPVYIDFVFSHQGYFTDQTRVFSVGSLSDELCQAHLDCLTIESEIVSRMKPGAIPSGIYADVNGIVDQMNIQAGFMGAGDNKVKFFGHGVGLVVDDYPVIARGFDDPLEEGMVLAVEPKRGFDGVGMVGIENTWHITEAGAESLTVGTSEIVEVSIAM
jgi:Xaa-Pro aminopeptidase